MPDGTIPNFYIGFALGYAVKGQESWWRENPLYAPYDRDVQGWWDNAVVEAERSGVHFVAPVTRGCNPCGQINAGDACPRELTKLVEAMRRRPIAPKAALFVDTASFPVDKNLCRRGEFSLNPPYDFGDALGAGEGGWDYFWKHNIEIFYDVIPQDLLFTIHGQPVIYFWSVAPGLGFANHRGNLKRFLEFIRASVRGKVGAEPFIVLDQTWVSLDPTITARQAEGVNDWFNPLVSACTIREWGGKKFAVSVPGFSDSALSEYNRRFSRDGGKTLKDCLARIDSEKTFLTLLEGLTNVEESAGFYRSLHPDWSYPEQYLDIVGALVEKNTRWVYRRPCLK